MRAFSFLHCADLHLGAPLRGLADLPFNLAERLREAPILALDRLVTTAIEHRVAAVIMSGDVFDAADRNLRAQIQLRDRLRKLDAAGIPTLIAAGNHDPLASIRASATLGTPSARHARSAPSSARHCLASRVLMGRSFEASRGVTGGRRASRLLVSLLRVIGFSPIVRREAGHEFSGIPR